MNCLKKRICRWLGLFDLQDRIVHQEQMINELRNVIKERTEYHINVSSLKNHNSQVILIGKYRNKDFINCYSIEDNDFKILIAHCSQLEKYASIDKINAWPSFKAVLNNELSKSGC